MRKVCQCKSRFLAVIAANLHRWKHRKDENHRLIVVTNVDGGLEYVSCLCNRIFYDRTALEQERVNYG